MKEKNKRTESYKEKNKNVAEHCVLHKKTQQYAQAGITLVALVVTIIVLLILAGVTIQLVLDNNGIIGRAKDASKTMANATANETTQMEKFANDVNELTSGYIGESGGSGTGTTYEVGQLVTLGTGANAEDFYVIKDNGSTVTLITKLCVETTNYTQSAEANDVAFDADNSTDEYVNADIKNEVDSYVTELKGRWNKTTANVTGRLLEIGDIEELGGVVNSEGEYTLSDCPTFVNGSYWLGTRDPVYAGEAGTGVFMVEMYSGTYAAFGTGPYNVAAGLRPVITVSKSDL